MIHLKPQSDEDMKMIRDKLKEMSTKTVQLTPMQFPARVAIVVELDQSCWGNQAAIEWIRKEFSANGMNVIILPPGAKVNQGPVFASYIALGCVPSGPSQLHVSQDFQGA